MSGGMSATSSGIAEQTENAAAGKLASYGVVAMGMAAVFGL